MFRKIVSNLSFSPALVEQLGFYARRLRKEEATRRIGLVFTALALVIQCFAIFSPPESANAANGNNVIYGGARDKNDLVGICNRGQDGAGHIDIKEIYAYFGISCQDIANGTQTTVNSRAFNLTVKSVGRSTYAWQRTPHAIPNTKDTTVYESLLYQFDSTSWTKEHGSTYPAVVGQRASDGQWFAVLLSCGNPAYITIPPPPPQPAALCKLLTITPISRTKFTFKSVASATNGATISGYTYTIKDALGSIVHTQTVPSTAQENTLDYTFTRDGDYIINVTVTTSIGAKTGANCEKPLPVSPEPRCPLNPSLPQSSKDCKPCEDDETIWYKDKNCSSTFELTKRVKNTTRNIIDANNTTALPGDRLEYHLIVKNTGKTSGSYTIKDNLTDVLEYADIVDLGGGTLTKKDATTPVEAVNVISWESVSIKPGEQIEKIVSVQIKTAIPAIPQSTGNAESYNCRIVNDFSGNPTTVNMICPPPKVVERVVTELPKTGATENMIFAGILLSIVTFFYARARQMKKEIRLIRKDVNTGTI